MPITVVLQAITVLWPIVEEIVKALASGSTPEFVTTLPDTLRSRVALNLRKAREAK